MQVSYFHDNSFVIHKAIVNGQKYSAWFDPKGRYKDASRIKGDVSYNVPSNHRHIIAELCRIARPHIKGE